jgi:hypothetical protein
MRLSVLYTPSYAIFRMNDSMKYISAISLPTSIDIMDAAAQSEMLNNLAKVTQLCMGLGYSYT